MTPISFVKTQTVGNDFVLLTEGLPDGVSPEQAATVLCQRSFGIGSDGLLLLSPPGPGEEPLQLRMFNPDGSEDYCGNGLRCAALHAVRQGWRPEGARFTIVQKGIRAEVLVRGGEAEAFHRPADFTSASVPVATEQAEFIHQMVEGVVGTAASTGSAHFIVLRGELPDEEEFSIVSPRIENSRLFPERISIMWAAPVGERRLALKIWERGAGPTLGCGTGSMAAAAVWSRVSGVTGELEIVNPGGSLWVSLEDWRSPLAARSRPQEPYSGRFFWDFK